MPEIVIADTSCLIVLTKVNQLDLLKLCYSKVWITEEIAKEFGSTLPPWIEIKQTYDKSLHKTLCTLVDPGEASAFTLALEIKDCLLVVDDRKARQLAKSLDLKVTGTLGIIMNAKDKGLISEVKPILEKLKITDFRISEKLIRKILELTGEN